MLPDRVSNPGPLTYESGALPIALRGPALTPVQVGKPWYNFFTTLIGEDLAQYEIFRAKVSGNGGIRI